MTHEHTDLIKMCDSVLKKSEAIKVNQINKSVATVDYK